ncbi:MAG TPA: AMP-binding protein, partial [Ktedonobacterales bacterium]|nr:AMP-binding protein [Ktedonobacterales bacterium]
MGEYQEDLLARSSDQGGTITPMRTDADDATRVAGADAAFARPWLAHYSADVPQRIDVPEQPLPWLVDEAARKVSARAAISYYGTLISYAQFASLVDRFARALVKLGVRHGDRVSLCLPNVPQFPIAFYGALKAGAAVVPTNPLYTQPELEHQLNDAGVKVVVTLDMLYHTLAAVRARTPVEQVIIGGVADYFPTGLALAYQAREFVTRRGKPHIDAQTWRDPTLHRFKDVIGPSHDRQGFEVYQLPTPAAPDDLAVLQYTGGTTGVAKGAMLTHRNLMANAVQSWAWSEQSETGAHSTLCVAPFFHSYGLTVAMNLSVLAGATMVLLPRFTIEDTLKAIERYKPDLFP